MFKKDAETDIRTDWELVEQARTGRQEAFGELIARHRHTCINIASFMLRDRSEAEDEVQKASIKAFEHLDQYHGEAEFVSWLLRIVVNQCLMLIRVKKRTRFLHIDAEKPWESTGPVELPADDRDPEEDVIGTELNAVLNREIRRIPPLLRNALVLRDVQELSMPDVAAQLKITIPAAKSRLLRARSELRNRMTVFCGPNGPGTSNRQRLGVKLRQLSAGVR